MLRLRIIWSWFPFLWWNIFEISIRVFHNGSFSVYNHSIFLLWQKISYSLSFCGSRWLCFFLYTTPSNHYSSCNQKSHVAKIDFSTSTFFVIFALFVYLLVMRPDCRRIEPMNYPWPPSTLPRLIPIYLFSLGCLIFVGDRWQNPFPLYWCLLQNQFIVISRYFERLCVGQMICGTLWARQPFLATYCWASTISSTKLCTMTPAEFANFGWPGRHLLVYWCAQLFFFRRGFLSFHYFGSFSRPSQ